VLQYFFRLNSYVAISGFTRPCDPLPFGCFHNQIAVNASPVNMILKTKCSFHDICFNTPPHEHGSLGVNAIMYDKYKVNNTIKAAEAYNPRRRCVGIIRSKATRSSVIGKAIAISPEKLPISGDLLKVCSNLVPSISLLTAVYTNNKINKAEMISTMVLLFIKNKVG
jgi:hypothetical protein